MTAPVVVFVTTDGAYLRCPGCQQVARADHDQIDGRVSLLCECGYHETHDLRASVAALRAQPPTREGGGQRC